jgi:hypothetical protein
VRRPLKVAHVRGNWLGHSELPGRPKECGADRAFNCADASRPVFLRSVAPFTHVARPRDDACYHNYGRNVRVVTEGEFFSHDYHLVIAASTTFTRAVAIVAALPVGE